MKYLCLLYQDESIMRNMSKDEADGVNSEYAAFRNHIKSTGHYLAGNALQPSGSATTVRVRNGRTAITDGPFVETKEQLAGYFLIEAKDLDDAIHVASGIPGAKLGCVEVRPILEMLPENQV